MAKMAPLVALYAGHPELKQMAEDVIRITQEDDCAVKAGVAGIQEHVQYLILVLKIQHNRILVIDGLMINCIKDYIYHVHNIAKI